MAFLEGQGILGRIPFVDGTIPPYDRTYLIVTAWGQIRILNAGRTLDTAEFKRIKSLL